MKKKNATAAEKAHLQRLAELGCIVCLEQFGVASPAEIHHPRHGQGLGQRAGHHEAIPLCATHHRHGGYGVAIHAGQREWERRYGTERELLEKVCQRLGLEDAA
ncbi:Recombination enhancement, RecA-dependent nuclease [compost metagenome]